MPPTNQEKQTHTHTANIARAKREDAVLQSNEMAPNLDTSKVVTGHTWMLNNGGNGRRGEYGGF
jgi:hypothetical protein